jgi:hypothetical protein
MNLYSRNAAVESAPMRNESVLFNPANNKFCLLNTTAALLWTKLETPQTVGELATTFERHFDGVDSAKASRDIEAALAQLMEVDCVVLTLTEDSQPRG